MATIDIAGRAHRSYHLMLLVSSAVEDVASDARSNICQTIDGRANIPLGTTI